MDKNIIRELLENGNYQIIEEKRYKNYAWRFKLSNKVSVFCGDSGSIWFQGKERHSVNSYLEKRMPNLKNNRVFIVYGRDLSAKNELEQLLNKWGIEALTIDSLPVEGRTIIEQLEHYIPQANYGIVIATPDDKGFLAGEDDIWKYRARQNVVLELGILFSKLGRNRVLILKKKCERFENPSDIDGILYVEYVYHVKEAIDKIRRELNKKGYEID